MRLIEDGEMPGDENMARDEALVVSVARGFTPALRLYSFRPYCITIGRFQEFPGSIDVDFCKRNGIDIVRRPTGGLAILHHLDFTYSVVLPFDGNYSSRREAFKLIAKGVVASLKNLGIEASIVEHETPREKKSTWCFVSEFGVDIEWMGRKICGSAQRVFSDSILQHGTLFFDIDEKLMESLTQGSLASKDKPFCSMGEAAGRNFEWEEVTRAFISGFSKTIGISFFCATFGQFEKEKAEELKQIRYSRREWLHCL